MENLLAVFIGAVIAALSGLVGLRLSRQTEYDQWLRNEKLETYTELISAFNTLLYHYATTHAFERQRKPREEVVDLLTGLAHNLNELSLVAPLSILNPAGEAQAAVLNLSNALTLPDGKPTSAEDFGAAFSTATEAIGTFLGHARVDLGASDKEMAAMKLQKWVEFSSRNLQ